MRRLISATVLLLAVVLAGCSDSDERDAGHYTVTLRHPDGTVQVWRAKRLSSGYHDTIYNFVDTTTGRQIQVPVTAVVEQE